MQVYALARHFPHLQFSLNGQVRSARHAETFLAPEYHNAGDGGLAVPSPLVGVMIGRAAYERPWQVSLAGAFLSTTKRSVQGLTDIVHA